jgi:hypothetical protein
MSTDQMHHYHLGLDPSILALMVAKEVSLMVVDHLLVLMVVT